MERGAGGIEAQRHQIILDAGEDAQGGILGDGIAGGFEDGRGDALGGGAVVVDAGAAAGGFDFDRDAGRENVAPGDLARALVELGQVHGAEAADAGENAGGAAQDEIGAPDIGPGAGKGDAALDLGRGEAGGARLFGQGGFEAGRGDEENVEGFTHGRAVAGAGQAGNSGRVGRNGGGPFVIPASSRLMED